MILRFVFIAYDESGARHVGGVSAIDMESAKLKLKEMNLIPVKITSTESHGKKNRAFFPFQSKPKLSDVEFLTSQLALLLKNGVKIDRALEIARKGIKNVILARIIEDIHGEIRRGTPISVCLEKYPDVFDSLYISLVKIGETTGRFAHVFENIADNLSFRKKIIADTRQAMIYPALIFAVCVLSVFFIFNFIVPRFSTIFSSMETVPIYTEVFLRISKLFRKCQYFIVPAVLGIIAFGSRLWKNEYLKRTIDAIVLRIPVTRGITCNLENLRFASAISVLLKSGVVLNQALDHAVSAVGNVWMKKKLLIVKKEIREGKRLGETISKTGFFPLEFNGLIEVGEETGSLAEVFSEIEERLKTNYEKKVAGLITLIEPIMIIIMGLIVGGLVVVMLLSIVSLSDIDF